MARLLGVAAGNRLVLAMLIALAATVPMASLFAEPTLAHNCDLIVRNPVDQGSSARAYGGANCGSGYHRLNVYLIKEGPGTVASANAYFYPSSYYPDVVLEPVGCAGSGYYYTFVSLYSEDHSGAAQSARSTSVYVTC
jgi:hypothetical protein